MELKGNRQGLRLILAPADVEAGPSALETRLGDFLSARLAFLGGVGDLRVEVPAPGPGPALLTALAAVFARFPQLRLRAVGERSERPILLPRREAAGPLIWRQTLRSGQELSHEGDIVVLGDVNAGARVLAGGDILVFGTLRGQAWAGRPHRSDARIFALRFQAVQVRIGDAIAAGQDAGTPLRDEPEYACYDPRTRQLVVEPWRTGTSTPTAPAGPAPEAEASRGLPWAR
ncbi:putative septum site-determining protein MinC [Candidatus Hydrogenisulfobacillus filiaventi]|uniref:Probable septum site-determining protein MinC n=1 Tax=Candidatus Hydrogenisulfobacillus filiaventi TaxID=2707344 RepID=A0A6F8ZED5_9FIRM|nr:septum site-determining protein MinC [Bacillota bacterium]CAB1128115.1 putative septum site-determining protein MinC [Candidatus Hydrogenisulfobacillus filiaventi]